MTTTMKTTIEADERVPIIRITRDFAASAQQLFTAHTDPSLFAQWVGPHGMETQVSVWDARDGGEWRYASRQDGEEYRFRGCFHTVSERRIVQTFSFEGEPDSIALETLTFEEFGGGSTRLHAQSLVDSFEARDAWLRMGMEVGVEEGYAKLDGVLDGAV
jgi:uncharacterized protein YndB with AHSA1/START domain